VVIVTTIDWRDSQVSAWRAELDPGLRRDDAFRLVILLIEICRHHIARHPGESRDPARPRNNESRPPATQQWTRMRQLAQTKATLARVKQ